ncbi:MAG: hypothetical protein HY911_04330 [Desulfobacterales bacterium]|nr:hypothetical protein [Desulfobacterales bacterium]
MGRRSVFQKTVADPDTTAALAVVEMEQRQDEFKLTEQQARERAIAQCHEVIGRIQGLEMVSKFADVSNLMWLKGVKEQKIYRDLPNIGTWDKFCDYIGISRQKVDEDLLNLRAFGEDFLTTVSKLRVGYRELRKLRQLAHEGDVVVDAECITIGDETIPITEENAEDIQAAIQGLMENKAAEIEEQQASIRAKDKVLKDKEKVINRQAKELAKLEGRAEAKGLTAEEDAILQDLDNSRTIFDGYLMKYDPDKNPLPEGATVRMRAKYMHTLDYFKRVIIAAFDTAADLYGTPEMDDDWLPPHLRGKGDDNSAEE